MATKQRVTEAEMTAAVTNTRQILKKAKKVSLVIPTDPTKPEETVYHGLLNGVEFNYPRNELVEVPEPIAELIQNQQKAIKMAKKYEDKYAKGSGKLVGGGQTREEALASAQALLGLTED